MPTKVNNNGWHHVVRNDGRHRSFKLLLLEQGSVHDFICGEIQPNKDVPASFSTLIEHLIKFHSHNCVKPHKLGLVASVGLRWEIKSSSCTHYVCAKNNTKENNRCSHKLHRLAAIDMYYFLQNSSLQENYNKDLQVVQNDKISWKIKLSENLSTKFIYVHPGKVVSIDMNNAFHLDPNDELRSIAVWYTDQSNPGCTWFLFPHYSIAIECSTTTIISWDGRKQHHCSCTCTMKKNRSPVYSILNSCYSNFKKIRGYQRRNESL